MLRYFLAYAVGITLTIGLGAWVNFSVDPAHIFDSGHAYEKGLASLLVDGWNVTNVANYDERITQRFYIQSSSKVPQVIVLGSSRSMQIRSDLFLPLTFFNHSVSGGSLEDYLAIYQLYRERNSVPGVIVIGVDPWIFNKNNGQTRWQSLSDDLFELGSVLGVEVPFQDSNVLARESSRYRQLISFPYLRESIASLWGSFTRQHSVYQATHETDLPNNTELADGSLVYAKYIRNRTEAEVRLRAASNARRGAIYALGGFQELDGRVMRALDLFVQLTQRDGSQLVFFLPPYHSAAFEIIGVSSKYKVFREVEPFLRQLATDREVPVVGSYDPLRAGCTDAEFTDDMHPRDSCVARLFGELDLSSKFVEHFNLPDSAEPSLFIP